MLQTFDLEFRPFIKEIEAKEEVIREFAGAASMERVRSMYSSTQAWCLDTNLMLI